jgi:hypothetical protein
MKCFRIVPRVLRPVAVALLVLASLSPLPAYYHFLHLRNDGGLRAIPERFDLRVLPDGAVPLVVSKAAEPELADGDTWDFLLSQVRLAAEQWSAVQHSALRLRYAGEVTQEPSAGTPHIQVMFEELPPGVIAMAGPVAREARAVDAHGEFVPISRSVVILSHRLRERPSYSEAFYMTLVHEMGHALGLQHSFTGSVMSTGVTRATTKAEPLAEDDHAGLASLYPGRHFAADTGVIRGRVTAGGDGLHFANVTALQPSGVAVSTITLPDGSYEIRGVPPGGYYLYAQPIAASSQEGLGPGQIVLPKDENGNAVAPGGLFSTRFFPDAQDWHAAHSLLVQPGGHLNDIHLSVPRVESRNFAEITTYSFPANFAVNPAVVETGAERPFLVAFGANLTENGQKADGLHVDSTAAGIVDEEVRAYDPAPQFLRVDLTFHPFTASLGLKPLLWSRHGETFVQPAAFRAVGQRPPDVQEALAEAGENGADRIRLRGTQLAPTFTYLFSGMVADRVPGGPDTQSNEVLLRAPYTADGRAVPVVALGRDGQSSLFLNAAAPMVPSRAAGVDNFRVDANSLPAGAECMVTLESDGPWFEGGTLGISFNTPHVVARRIWRTAPNRIVANLRVEAAAPQGEVRLWLRKDLAVVDSQRTLSIAPADPNRVTVDSAMRDEITGDAAIYPGATALLGVAGEALPDTLPIRLADRLLTAQRHDGAVFRLAIPHDLPVGLATLQPDLPGRSSFPIAVELAGPPPAILDAQTASRSAGAEGSRSYRSRLLVQLPGIDPEQRANQVLRIRVNGRTIPGVDRTILETGDQLQLAFDLPGDVTAGSGNGDPTTLSVQVEWNNRHSAPATLSLSGTE